MNRRMFGSHATRAQLFAALFGVMVLSMLPGITRCNVLCKDVDGEGNPITYQCVQCQVTAAEKVECKEDIWFLEPGELCDQAAQQPDLPDGELCDFAGTDDGVCNAGVCEGPLFACTEQGVLDAIAAGGGTINCTSPTTINTTAEIVIANDVVLDGRGNLTLDAGDTHRVVRVTSGVTAELRRLTITGGNATTAPSGLIAGHGIYNAGDLTLSNVAVVSNGTMTSLVGGIFSQDGVDPSLRVIDSVVSSNRSTGAYGIAAGIHASGTLEIIRSTVSANEIGTAVSVGPCVLVGNYISTVTIEDSTISSANEDVGVSLISYGPSVTMTIKRSTVSGLPNAAVISSCGSPGSALSVSDSTFVGGDGYGLSVDSGLDTATLQNTTATGGIGVLVRGDGPLSATLVNSTMLGATLGITNCGSTNVTLRGSVLSPGCGITSDCGVGATTFSSLGYNVDTDGSCAFSEPTDQTVSVAALNLGPLQDNGGSTQTILPGPGSPAIDAIPVLDCVNSIGLRLTNDQRGVLRPQGANCDVGAVEVEQP